MPTINRYDHNSECIGCGAHVADPHAPTCPLPWVGAAVILRGAVAVLPHFPAGSGYDVPAAILSATGALNGQATSLDMAECAVQALAAYLRRQWGKPLPVGDEDLVRTFGHGSNRQLIGRALYAAAARLDGRDYDPDTFGTLPD